ncbi:hypothetical protein OESDEN_21779 [Oesophagostomum dentatum]|uniref:Uncharacterized protein n=1 Tax=Oesophagostomum dentatum TaxID=61180 RepID=A0A0B1RZT0_OESDE|nr:hypothetical protein OESDEN_21779 [Oesophagostomum dentatum]
MIPTREKVIAEAIHTETLQKEDLFESTSKSKSAVPLEKGKLAQAKATPRSSKRRKTTLPDLPPSSNGCIADSAKKRPVPELELDTDVVLRATKRRKTIATERVGRSAASMVDSPVDNDEVQLEIPPRRKAGRLTTMHPAVAASSSQAEPRRRTTATCSSASVQRTSDEDEVQFVESGFAHRRRRSLTPPILVVAVDFTSSFVPIKRDNNRCAEPITLPACNRGEAVSLAIYSSDTAEVLNALALDIIIGEASAPLEDIEPSTLPPNFTTIFERATPLQYRHRLDYNSFNTMLLNRLPENGLHALTLDSRKVSMLKITKFVDTIKEAVEDICEELRNRKNLSKAEIKKEIDLSGEVQQLITSRYVETMMKMADACGAARDVPLAVIADRFHLLLCGWQCFLQQGGVLRVRVQICPGRSHPGIVDITTAWLDKIDTVLSRAQATKSMRTAAFAVSLAQEKTIISKNVYIL